MATNEVLTVGVAGKEGLSRIYPNGTLLFNDQSIGVDFKQVAQLPILTSRID